MPCAKVKGEVLRFHERVRTYEVSYATYPSAPLIFVSVVGISRFYSIETKGWREALAVARYLVRGLRGMERTDMGMVLALTSCLKIKRGQ